MQQPIATSRNASPLALWRQVLARFGPYAMHRSWLEGRFRRAGLTEHQVHIGPHHLRYWSGGDGPPLLLLHGFGGDATLTWASQVASLARRHRLIIPDLLWFGASWSEVEDFTLEHQCDAFGRLMDLHEISTFDLLGISYGGLVTFAMAHLHPERIARACMVASPGPAYHRDDHEAALARFGVDDLAGVVLPEDADGVRQLIELAWLRPPPTPRFVLEDVYRHAFTHRVPEKRALLEAVQQQRETLALRGWVVDQPVLLLWGDHDPLFPLHVGLRLQEMLPNARLVVLPDTRHAPNVEAARRFNREVLRFLGEPRPG